MSGTSRSSKNNGRNVCFICISLRPGGTERVVARAANYLTQDSEVTILLLSRASTFYKLNPNVTLVQPKFAGLKEVGWKWPFKVLIYLWRAISAVKPAVILCFGEAIAPLIVVVARLNRIPVIVFNRASPLSSLRGVRGLINPLIYPMARFVVVQTKRAADLLRPRYRFCRFEVFPNPISLPDKVPPTNQREIRVINVGSLGGKKSKSADANFR